MCIRANFCAVPCVYRVYACITQLYTHIHEFVVVELLLHENQISTCLCTFIIPYTEQIVVPSSCFAHIVELNCIQQQSRNVFDTMLIDTTF